MDQLLCLILIIRLQRERDLQWNSRWYMRYLRDTSDLFDIPESQFLNRFRFPPLAVQELIEILRPHDSDLGSTIPFHIKVLAALYFYSTGSYQICVGYSHQIHLSQPSVSRSISYISTIIVDHLARELIKFPTTPEDVSRTKELFEEKYGMRNIIGIIDGTHIPIIAPPATDEEHHPRHYRNRKKFYSINVEMICDASLCIISVNPKFPGGCHDSGIWLTSKVRSFLEREWRPENQMFLLGDNGYPIEPWLLVPYANPTQEYEVSYNRVQVANRKNIERMFGILKSTFRSLNGARKLNYHPVQAAYITIACCTLYNYMKYNDLPFPEVVNASGNITDHDPVTQMESILAIGRRVRDEYAQNL